MKIILDDLTPCDHGWESALAESAKRFFGLRLRYSIDTRHIPSSPAILPRPHESQLQLAKEIGEELDQIIGKAEGALRKWHVDREVFFDSMVEKLTEPTIWIRLQSTDKLHIPEPRKDKEWTLVVGIKENPDFGYNIEFDGNKVIEVWAGD
jgi:hypothetical protein